MKQQNTHWYSLGQAFTSNPLLVPVQEVGRVGVHSCKKLACTELHICSVEWLTTVCDLDNSQYERVVERAMSLKGKVPTMWADTVCYCELQANHNFDHITKKSLCKTCGKMGRWNLYECVACESIFMYDFHHPAFDMANPQCWHCIEINDPDGVCEDYPPGAVKVHIARGKVPPQFPKHYASALADPNARMPTLQEILAKLGQ